jgi:lysophospholipase L1-like esterase
LPRLATDAVVLAFGDSLTFGTGAASGADYPSQLAKKIGRRVVNAGVPGETTTQGLERLPAVLAEVNPQLVLLCLGGNDLLRRQDPEQMAANLRAMIQRIRASGAHVLLIAVPTPAYLRLSDAPQYQALARSEGVPLAQDVIADVLSNKRLRSDPVHPNAEGYREVAAALADELRALGAL